MLPMTARLGVAAASGSAIRIPAKIAAQRRARGTQPVAGEQVARQPRSRGRRDAAATSTKVSDTASKRFA
jgi:hypothetical protein